MRGAQLGLVNDFAQRLSQSRTWVLVCSKMDPAVNTSVRDIRRNLPERRVQRDGGHRAFLNVVNFLVGDPAKYSFYESCLESTHTCLRKVLGTKGL